MNIQHTGNHEIKITKENQERIDRIFASFYSQEPFPGSSYVVLNVNILSKENGQDWLYYETARID